MAGIWQRWFPKPAPAPEARRATFSTPGWSVGLASGSSPFTAARAENLSTVLACTGAISSGLASLPATVYRREAKGRTDAPRHPVSALIENGPNPYQSWPDWLEMMIASALMFGNAISVVQSDDGGNITGLLPVPWNAGVLLSLLPNGRLVYDIRPTNYVSFPVNPGRYFADEVWHLRDRSDNGLVGRSRLSRVPELLNGLMDLQTHASSVWRNGAAPSGFLEHPGVLSPEAKQNIRQEFDDTLSGPTNARKIGVLEEGMKFTGASPTPEDSELLESRKFSVAELCRIMQVPPPIVQSYANNTFTNSQQADQWFARHSLMPWARKIETEFKRTVFGAGSPYHLEIDFSAMVRGSYETRWQVGMAAVAAGVMTRNELREQEGLSPLPAGDWSPPAAGAAGTGGGGGEAAASGAAASPGTTA